MNVTSEKSYTVQGMTCGHCELSGREAVEELERVESAEADPDRAPAVPVANETNSVR